MSKSLITTVQLFPVLISYLIIAAHFLRNGNIFVVAIYLFLLLSLLVRHSFVARVVQVSLVLAGIEWILTTIVLVNDRITQGTPWIRLAIILGTVVCFTFASAGVFFLKNLAERYQLSSKKKNNA